MDSEEVKDRQIIVNAVQAIYRDAVCKVRVGHGYNDEFCTQVRIHYGLFLISLYLSFFQAITGI